MKKNCMFKGITALLLSLCLCLNLSAAVFGAESPLSEKNLYTYEFSIVDGKVQSTNSVNGSLVINSPKTSGTMDVTAQSSAVGFGFILDEPYKAGTGTITFTKGSITKQKVMVDNSLIIPVDGKYHKGCFEGNKYLTKGAWNVSFTSNVPVLCLSISVATN